MLVLLILLPLFAAILQLGLALYVRNTLVACAQEGARYAADADIVQQGTAAVSDAAVTRARDCITGSLSNTFANDITADSPAIAVDGTNVDVVEVRVESPLPVFGFFGIGSRVVHVKSDALQERA